MNSDTHKGLKIGESNLYQSQFYYNHAEYKRFETRIFELYKIFTKYVKSIFNLIINITNHIVKEIYLNYLSANNQRNKIFHYA